MHKSTLFLFSCCLCLLSSLAFATWQVANPYLQENSNRIANPALGQSDYPAKYLNGSRYEITTYKDTLKNVVQKNAAKYNWQVIWKAPMNLPVLTKTRIAGVTFPVAMNRLLAHYDVYAVYDKVNRKMTVFGKHKLKMYAK
ncbi:MAG: hypothetical protein ABIH77_02060 [Pseudomonadota bacterium]|nr:toxin co-regulated pilus biosynthesis Q family protein [Gammaproteobacteria bacterium]MBU1629300.1 toxin co-regulated pilus biosynthesis Q family protein [Gammaproteobacteria bacterium]MBU2546635.1 toxin co-regulated pilus biosynthesis Q family protein [Gammaproteobacteria bacterium]